MMKEKTAKEFFKECFPTIQEKLNDKYDMDIQYFTANDVISFGEMYAQSKSAVSEGVLQKLESRRDKMELPDIKESGEYAQGYVKAMNVAINELKALTKFKPQQLKDEEIEEEGQNQWGNVHRTGVLGFVEGAKWYREQTKSDNTRLT